MTLAAVAEQVQRGYDSLIYTGLFFVLLLVIAIVWLRRDE
jgi:hypothetical protein